MLEVNKIYKGNCMDLFKQLDDESIDCVITSPPYWQLRDYKWGGQWGLEPTFQEYLEHLWQMMDEVWRVLKPTGTVWINLGDTYARGSRPCDSDNQLGHKDKDNFQGKGTPDYNGLNKCLLLIPHRFAIGCIDRGWIMRNDIIWAKRNGMPESVTDRFSKKHEYIFLMAKEDKYYFDLDGIRDRSVTLNKIRDKSNENYSNAFISPLGNGLRAEQHPLGKNPGSVSDFWDVSTKPSSGEHYAAYNDELISKAIIAGCAKDGIILDPFCGTATTGRRALDLDRKFIGFDGSEKYVRIANKNILPFLIQEKLL